MQDHPEVEIVLVADPGSLNTRPDLPLKRVAFDAPNISEARNAGIAAAAGEVTAFIDDDAIAEPTWATRLSAPFVDAAVIAAGGWTRGPYGRTWQSRGEMISAAGARALPVDPQTRLVRPEAGAALGLVGTNCAFRRSALVAVGGFDPAFAYHLDESDLAMRLAARFPEAASALVPLAEVTHGTAPSERRSSSRMPREVGLIARSEALFARRHGGDPSAILPRIRRSIINHMLAGRIEPQKVAAFLETAGHEVASTPRPEAPPAALSDDPPDFLRLPTRARTHRVLTGRWINRESLRLQAERAALAGDVVTLIMLLPGLLPQRTRFTPGGWWEQTGGGWGASQPGDPTLLPISRARRFAREKAVLAAVRTPSVIQPFA